MAEESASMRVCIFTAYLLLIVVAKEERGGSGQDYQCLFAGRGIVIPILSEAVNRAGSWCLYIHLHGIFNSLFH
jgi:hypothetical protein